MRERDNGWPNQLFRVSDIRATGALQVPIIFFITYLPNNLDGMALLDNVFSGRVGISRRSICPAR